LGISTAAVSKRLAYVEARLGLSLMNRTTRRMSLTPEGEVLYEHARRIVGEIDDLDQLLSKSKGTPQGLLRVNATLGFGRIHVAPVIGRYAALHPQVDVQLQLSAHPPPVSEDAFDVCVRFGDAPDSRVIARRLAPNRRLLCASPKYIAAHGTPNSPGELARHNCIGIRQGDDAYGVWRLSSGRGAKQRTETVKIRGNLTTNDGEIAVSWALDGHGILMRAEWDIQKHLASGRLVPVLPQYRTPEANIYAVYAHRHQLSVRVRSFVDFLAEAFSKFDVAAR
jgi:DNA-binding transcriptional LysR family regulator